MDVSRSTRKTSCFTPLLALPVVAQMFPCTSLASSTLSAMFLSCMNSNIIALSGELGSQPSQCCLQSFSIMMTAFSRCAALSFSPARRIPMVYVSMPRAMRPLGRELVCMEIKMSALFLLAIFARSCSGTNTSVLRVYTTFTSGQQRSTYLPKASATLRFMFFSSEKAPRAPAS